MNLFGSRIGNQDWESRICPDICEMTQRKCYSKDDFKTELTSSEDAHAYECFYCGTWHIAFGSISKDTDGRITKEPGER